MVDNFFNTPTGCMFGLMAILVLATGTGCQVFHQHQDEFVQGYWTEQPANHFVSPYFNQLQAHKIVIVVRDDRENSYQLQTRFGEHLRSSLSQKGLFEVAAVIGHCEIAPDGQSLDEMHESKLLELSRRYGTDGILFCDVDSFSAFEPLKMACSLTFFDTRESIVTLHTQGVWDSTSQRTRKSFTQYICRKHKCRAANVGIYLKSPAEYLDFVATDLSCFLLHTAVGSYFPN